LTTQRFAWNPDANPDESGFPQSAARPSGDAP
jgi:hypothetical protein